MTHPIREFLKGKDRAELAEKLGCSESYLSLMNTGQRKPSRELANKIAKESGNSVPTTCWDEPFVME